MNPQKWLYAGGHPNWLATILNRCSAALHALGIAPNYLVTLEVPGRQSGRTATLPLVMAVVESERYLVSMLGPKVDWVQNVKAAGGNVTLSHGRREKVQLEEVHTDRRATVLKAYLKRAPGARPHFSIDKDAPLPEFERVAADYPVFHVTPENLTRPATRAPLTLWGRILLFLFLFIGLGAAAGSVGVMKEIMPFPEVWLQGTPFHSYFYPGLILCLIVGGTQFAAAFILLWHSSASKMASLIAGLVLTGWIVGEFRLIGFQAPIQICFVAVGLVEVGLSFASLRRA